MNPDFAIILNFKITGKQDIDYDQLVKKARNIGVRAICGTEQFNKACKKYTIQLYPAQEGLDLTAENVIDTIVKNRQEGKATIINLTVTDGQLTPSEENLLKQINNWMHMFGHALNEGAVSDLKLDQTGFVLENRHANYQKYVFLKTPLPSQIVITGLTQEPNRVEWIENRVDLDFNFKDDQLTIKLTPPDDDFEWQVLRIQAHRPEDEIGETKF